MDEETALRYIVLKSMVKLAGQNDLLSMVPIDMDQVQFFFFDWAIMIL